MKPPHFGSTGLLRQSPPPRYLEPWRAPVDAAIHSELVEGATVLDVGSGRTPAIPADRRPAGCHYVGLDISRAELEAAPPDAYDETVVGDLANRVPALAERFDLIVGWYVLEHVRPLPRALENVRSYARPGGSLVALLSGRNAVFAVINRLVPHRIGVWSMRRLLGTDPDIVFPAHYDGCYHTALTEMLRPWTKAEVVPRYRGGQYLRFSRILQAGYLTYEDWIVRSDRRNLATHYLIKATR